MKRCGAMRLVAVLVAWAATVCAQKASSVVCVGDSITWGRTDGKHGDLAEDGSEAYPFQLEEKLGWSHWEVRNLGVSGATAQDIKGDGYMNYKEEEYAEALEAAADYYVVILGTNDAKTAHWNASGYEAAIVDLCESFASVGGAVVLGAPPPIVKDYSDKWGDGATSPIIGSVYNSVACGRDTALKESRRPPEDVGPATLSDVLG